MYSRLIFFILVSFYLATIESQAAKKIPRYDFVTQVADPDSEEGKFCLGQCGVTQQACEIESESRVEACVGRATDAAEGLYEIRLKDFERREAEWQLRMDQCENSTKDALVTLAGCLDVISARPFQQFTMVGLIEQQVKSMGCRNQNLCAIERSNCSRQCGTTSLTIVRCSENCTERDGPKKVKGYFASRKNIPEGMTLVYFYRPSTGGYRAYKAYISANRQDVVALKSGQFYEYIVPAGAISFQTKFAKEITSINDVVLTAGATYYLRSFLDSGFFAKKVVSQLMPVPEEIATAEMHGMRGERSKVPISKAAVDPTIGMVTGSGSALPSCKTHDEAEMLSGCISGLGSVTGTYRQAYHAVSAWSVQASNQLKPVLQQEGTLRDKMTEHQQQIKLLGTDKRKNRKEIKQQKKEEKAAQRALKKALGEKRSICRNIAKDGQSLIADHDRLISSGLKRARGGFKQKNEESSAPAGNSLSCEPLLSPELVDCAQALAGVNGSLYKAHESMLAWSLYASDIVVKGKDQLAEVMETLAATSAEIDKLTELDKKANRKAIRKLKRQLRESQKAEKRTRKLNLSACSELSSGAADKVDNLGNEIDLSFERARDFMKSRLADVYVRDK